MPRLYKASIMNVPQVVVQLGYNTYVDTPNDSQFSSDFIRTRIAYTGATNLMMTGRSRFCAAAMVATQ